MRCSGLSTKSRAPDSSRRSWGSRPESWTKRSAASRPHRRTRPARTRSRSAARGRRINRGCRTARSGPGRRRRRQTLPAPKALTKVQQSELCAGAPFDREPELASLSQGLSRDWPHSGELARNWSTQEPEPNRRRPELSKAACG
eukprot:3256788-Alexandrium_andersonii.AAC.1